MMPFFATGDEVLDEAAMPSQLQSCSPVAGSKPNCIPCVLITTSDLPPGSSTSSGGQGVSRLNDLNPEDIESIEVVKGPAAATLYGADASAGVIQIITKRGQSGTFRQNVLGEVGTIDVNWAGY